MSAPLPAWIERACPLVGGAADGAAGKPLRLSTGEQALLALAAHAGGLLADPLADEILPPPGRGEAAQTLVGSGWRTLEERGIVRHDPQRHLRQICSRRVLETLDLPLRWRLPDRRARDREWFLVADFLMHYGRRAHERPVPLWLLTAAEKRERVLADAGGPDRMPGIDPELAPMPFGEGWPLGSRDTPGGREWVFGIVARADEDFLPRWLDRHAALLRGLHERDVRVELRWITDRGDGATQAQQAAGWRRQEATRDHDRLPAARPGAQPRQHYADPTNGRLLDSLVEVRRLVLNGTARSIDRWQPGYGALLAAPPEGTPVRSVPGLLAYHDLLRAAIGEDWEMMAAQADAQLNRTPAATPLGFRFVPWISDLPRDPGRSAG